MAQCGDGLVPVRANVRLLFWQFFIPMGLTMSRKPLNQCRDGALTCVFAAQERGLHAAYRKYTLLLSTIFSLTMTPATNSQQRPRKDCTYNAKELEQILPFKNMFIEASTIPERILILRSQILPAMFNYWATNGKDPRDQEESQLWAKV
jgi:hypothetical protein